MKNFLILTVSIFFFSCQQKENKSAVVETSESSTSKTIKKENKEVNKQIADTIFMKSKDDKGLYMAEGKIDSIHPIIYVKFTNEYTGELNGKILPETGAGNIRFNQIIFPDKTSDGPFGIDLKINIEQKGNYILVIGHSQMADNPYWGKFNVQLENKKK